MKYIYFAFFILCISPIVLAQTINNSKSNSCSIELTAVKDIQNPELDSNIQDRKLYLKSTTGDLELLDYVITTDANGDFMNKLKYTYDDNNLIIKEFFQWDNVEQKWEYSQKTECEYNNRGLLSMEVVKSWDSENNVWLNKEKKLNEYNSDNNQTLFDSYIWNGSWVSSFRIETQWGTDIHSNTTKVEIRFLFDNDLAQYKPIDKRESIYEGTTLIFKQDISYNWIGDAWIPSSKYEQLDDDDGYDKTQAEYTWNTTVNKFEPNYKTGFLYNEDKSLKIRAHYSWDSQDWDWHSKIEEEFGAKELLISETIFNKNNQVWVPVSKVGYEDDYVIHYELMDNNFVPSYKERSKYDNSVYLINFERHDWNIESEAWYLSHTIFNKWDEHSGSTKINQKIEEIFDRFGNQLMRIQLHKGGSSINPWNTSLTYRIIREYNEDSQIISNEQYNLVSDDWDDENPNENSWSLKYRSEYYYSPGTPTNTSDLYSASVLAYPNPVTNILTIEGTSSGDQIRIIDVNGNFLATEVGADQETTLDVSQLPQGVLIVNVNGTSFKVLKK